MIENTMALRAALEVLQLKVATMSSSEVSNELYKLAMEVWAATPRKKPLKKEPEIVNAGQLERDGLSHLQRYLGYAIDNLWNVIKQIGDRKTDNIADGYPEDKALQEALKHVETGEILGNIEAGLNYLTSNLQKIEKITEEKELTKAVATFHKAVDAVSDKWSGDLDALKIAVRQLIEAQNNVPNALTGPGALRMLQESFDTIAKVCETLWNIRIPVPKIPKALSPENPLQLKLFASSPKGIQEALEDLQKKASKPNPSRQEIASGLIAIAHSISQ